MKEIISTWNSRAGQAGEIGGDSEPLVPKAKAKAGSKAKAKAKSETELKRPAGKKRPAAAIESDAPTAETTERTEEAPPVGPGSFWFARSRFVSTWTCLWRLHFL